MKKIMNLNERAAIKTKLIIFAIIVLSSMVIYAEGQNTTESTLEQTTEKYAIAQSQPAAVAWENGTNTQTAHTQKAMENPEIPAKQGQQVQMKPALPLNQKDAIAQTQSQTTEVEQESSESIPSTTGNGIVDQSSMNKQNNLLYIGVLVVLLLAVFLFMQGRKRKTTGQGTKKD